MKKKSYSLKLQYNSPVVLTFALACLGVLALSWLTSGKSTHMLFCVYRAPLTDLLTYPRMVLHVLGHSGYDHFLSNMTLLLVIGPPLEERYGSEKLLWCILITALVSGLVQFIFFPGSALMGASGIVFMMILLASLSGMSKGHIPLTFLLVAAIYLGDEVIAAITQRDNISQLTHIVGGLCGGALGMSMRRK
ncbi:MAG: rhomboid family intramembrane serine protease [Oscillospiraceae bacterium]|nr:rhomboid family intramembrane serine protease [Oscillospiraceae bacterium]